MIADAAPLSPDFQLGIISLLGIALLVLGIMAYFRRHPPLDSVLVKFKISIDTLQKSVDGLIEGQKVNAIHSIEIGELKTKVLMLGINRENDLHAQRKYTRETSERIFMKIGELDNTLSLNLRSIENRLGHVNGSFEQLVSRINNLKIL